MQMAAQRMQELSLNLEQVCNSGSSDAITHCLVEILGEVDRLARNYANHDREAAAQFHAMVLTNLNQQVERTKALAEAEEEDLAKPSPAAKSQFGNKKKSTNKETK